MKPTIAAAFGVGALLGGVVVWLLMEPRQRGADGGPGERPIEAPPLPPDEHRASSDVGSPPTAARVDARVDSLQERVAGLEASVEETRREARRNLLKGALVLLVNGRAPEELLRPIQGIAPEPGAERFGRSPDLVVDMPWQYLHTLVEEDFEEALAKSLDRQLRWTEAVDLKPEEVAEIRSYTARAYRFMVEVQRRQRTLRKRLADPGALSPEERKSIETQLHEIGDLDHRAYVASYAPWPSIQTLFPAKASRK